MFTPSRWLADSIAFLKRMRELPGDVRVDMKIAPPLPATKLEELQEMSRLPIPASLKRFWLEASRHAQGRYWWDTPADFHMQKDIAFPKWDLTHIWGGPEFSPAEEVCSLTHDMVSWSEGFGTEYPRDARLWLHSLPLIPVGNGDFVGLYVRDNAEDPPVVYLCHEGSGGSRTIAPNLETFLERWAEVGYVGMDLAMAFCPPERQFDPAAFPVEREATQALLAGVVRDDLARPRRCMTPATWKNSADPEPMIDWLEERGLLDEARLRIYGCACCRRVWDRLGPWTRRALEVAERFTRGKATERELTEARAWLSQGEAGKKNQLRMRFPTEMMDAISDSIAFGKTQGPFHRIAYAAIDANHWISSQITAHLDDPDVVVERAAHAELIRQVFGHPF